MSEKGKPPRIGKDGYTYFTYGEGATWEVETETGTSRYRIIEPRWKEETERELYLVEVYKPTGKAQEEKLREMSIERLNYLLSGNTVKTIEEGELVELPLLREEVERYYQNVVWERNKQKRAANAKLKEDKDYKEILAEEKLTTPLWQRAIAMHSEEEAEIEKRMKELARKKKAILKKYGINAAILNAPESCEECDGKGITEKGIICACAKAQRETIKAYIAAGRIVERRKKEQLKVEE